MPQSDFLPVYDVSKTESIDISAPANIVYPLVEDLNFQDSRLIYWLFKLRGIPVPESMSLKGLEKISFTKLTSVENERIVIGLIGQFWTPSGKLKKFTPEEFSNFNDKHYAKATWSFELVKISDSSTKVSTETRVLCPTESTRRKFKLYWTVIQPFSSRIRTEILKSLKRQAEK